MDEELVTKLLDIVKKYLKVTSKREDDSIKDFIRGGISTLTSIAGPDIDFENDFSSKQLLKDYCRYAYNGSLEFFEENFSRQILRLQLNEAARAFKRSD